MSPLVIAAITALLQIIQTVVLPNLNSASTIATVITAIEQLVPIVLQGAQSLVPFIKNIVASLRGNGEITTEQLDALDTLEAQLDAAFDAAADAAEKQDQQG